MTWSRLTVPEGHQYFWDAVQGPESSGEAALEEEKVSGELH